MFRRGAVRKYKIMFLGNVRIIVQQSRQVKRERTKS